MFAFCALVLGFAVISTGHVTLVVGVSRRQTFRRGLVALVCPPLALLWGARAGLWGRVAFLVGGILLYVAGWLMPR